MADELDDKLMIIWEEAHICSVRLACGHWSQELHEASSTWDFPMDTLYCNSCRDERCMDIALQVLMLNEEMIPEDKVRYR